MKFSERSSCSVSDINGHRTSCKKPEMWEIRTISLQHLVLEHLYFVSANEQEMSHFRLPAEHTTKTSAIIRCQNQTLLPSLYQQTAIIFLGHSNIKMLTTFVLLPLDVMYSTTRHKRLGRSWITQWISAQLNICSWLK